MDKKAEGLYDRLRDLNLQETERRFQAIAEKYEKNLPGITRSPLDERYKKAFYHGYRMGFRQAFWGLLRHLVNPEIKPMPPVEPGEESPPPPTPKN